MIAALFLAACGGSGFSYVKNSDDHTYFKVPQEWKVFDEDTIINTLGKNLSKRARDTERDQNWQVAFDANTHPSLKHLLDPNAKFPTGLAMVNQLSFNDADSTSLGSLRNSFFDVDAAVQANAGEIVSYEPVELDGGFHGFHLVADLDLTKKATVRLDQTSLLDQATSKLYTLLVSCTAKCYDRYQSDIEKVVNSWTVRDH